MSTSSRSGEQQPSYPPSVYAQGASDGHHDAPPSGGWWWLLATAGLGLPIGALWWLIAPGGAAYSDSADPTVWLAQEMTLAVIVVVTGIVVGCVVSTRASGSVAIRTVASVLGAVVGSVVAWQLGTLLGGLTSEPNEGHLGMDTGFGLRSVSILVLWPLATAVVVLLLSGFGPDRRPNIKALRPGTSN